MQQISIFDGGSNLFPSSHDDILKLHAQYIAEGEKDPDAFTWSDIKNGKSYFFYGKKVFEFTTDSSGKSKLRIPKENNASIVLTADSADSDIIDQINILKETKRTIFRNLITETFACCNDFNRCSDALKCLHPENRMYNGCMYRKNLEAGKVFYGKNKNVAE